MRIPYPTRKAIMRIQKTSQNQKSGVGTNPTITASIGDPGAPTGLVVNGQPGFDISALQLPERRPNDIAQTQLQNAFSNLRLL